MSRYPIQPPPSPEDIEAGVPLPSLNDERFCLLIVRGTPPCEAHRTAYPQNKNHSAVAAKGVLDRQHISQRIDFLRQEIAMRTTISLAQKRDMLARMALNEIPSEIIELPSGKKIQKFQSLAAIKYDAKLSGEESAKKIDVMGTGLKLSFVLPSRDGTTSTNTSTPIPLELPPSFLDEPKEIDEDGETFEPTLSTPEDFASLETHPATSGDSGTPEEIPEPTGEITGNIRSTHSEDGDKFEEIYQANIINSATGISGKQSTDNESDEDEDNDNII